MVHMRHTFLGAVLFALFSTCWMAEGVSGQAEPVDSNVAATFRNPLKVRDGADPWMAYHNGWYYLATTSGVDVRIRRAKRLAELKDARDTVVWKDENPSRSRHIWAPEFHRFEGGNGPRWYLYYTASDDRDENHRLYVAESDGDDPMSHYTFKAKLSTDAEDRHYAIDGTILTMPNGSLYFVWCGRPSSTGQGLYLSRMENPWTLLPPRVALPAAGFGCDVVREGPVPLRQGREGRVFLIYSACPADTPDYKLGMLSIDPDGDPMDVSAWRQHPDPVFVRNDAGKVYGPGHNFFFKSPDSKEDWIVYHAKTGTERTYADRTTRAQPFTWNPDGTPNFGPPLPLDTDIHVPSGESVATSR